jgi:hypothetical protein
MKHQPIFHLPPVEDDPIDYVLIHAALSYICGKSDAATWVRPYLAAPGGEMPR